MNFENVGSYSNNTQMFISTAVLLSLRCVMARVSAFVHLTCKNSQIRPKII